MISTASIVAVALLAAVSAAPPDLQSKSLAATDEQAPTPVFTRTDVGTKELGNWDGESGLVSMTWIQVRSDGLKHGLYSVAFDASGTPGGGRPAKLVSIKIAGTDNVYKLIKVLYDAHGNAFVAAKDKSGDSVTLYKISALSTSVVWKLPCPNGVAEMALSSEGDLLMFTDDKGFLNGYPLT